MPEIIQRAKLVWFVNEAFSPHLGTGSDSLRRFYLKEWFICEWITAFHVNTIRRARAVVWIHQIWFKIQSVPHLNLSALEVLHYIWVHVWIYECMILLWCFGIRLKLESLLLCSRRNTFLGLEVEGTIPYYSCLFYWHTVLFAILNNFFT